MILAGDIGGTKTLIALYEQTSEGLHLVREVNYPSQAHTSLEQILADFMKQSGQVAVRAACFGVAGAVVEGKCTTTNLPWTLAERDLAQALKVPTVKLLNDLEATAFGMLYLKPEELVELNAGHQPPRKGNVAVIAAGTGLGEAFLYWDGIKHLPMASEGGHADFAPRNELEIDLLLYLRKQIGGRVSYERVLSGPGIYKIYCFLRDTGRGSEAPEVAEQLKTNDPSPLVTRLGLAGKDPLCVAALELFSTLYGAEAGNLALISVSLGGVYIGGGIAPRLLPILQNGGFLRAFTDKGRFRSLLSGIPIRVSLNARTALLGAAEFALQL